MQNRELPLRLIVATNAVGLCIQFEFGLTKATPGTGLVNPLAGRSVLSHVASGNSHVYSNSSAFRFATAVS
jgi:hypothetical protein